MNAIPLPVNRISEILRRLEFFQGVGAETLQQLSAGARQIQVRRNEEIFHKGMPAETLHIVVSGQIKVFLTQPNASEKVVALVEHGQSFGVASVWLGGAYLADAVANKDSYLLTLERGMLKRLACVDCALTSRLMDAVSQQVVDLMRNLESCMPKSAQQRVACYFTQRRLSTIGDSFDVRLPTTKREIATKLNLTQETFSRVLRQLAAEGIISVKGRDIRVLSAERLTALKQTMPMHSSGEHP